jgi:hypothetical protein
MSIAAQSSAPDSLASNLEQRSCSSILLPVPRCAVLVELTGIEPVTSWLQTRRSPS